MAFVTASKGRLVLDFAWRKVRCREYLALADTKEGRAEAKRIRRQIEGELTARTFDYLKWFPDGAKKQLFAPATPDRERIPSFAGHAREWLENKKAWFSAGTYYDRGHVIE